jgi:predicted amidohydrolase
MKHALTCCLIGLCIIACGDPDIVVGSLSDMWTAGMEYDDSDAPVRLGVATVCLEADPEPAVNRAQMIDRVDAIVAAHPDVRLIVFGETSLGYYYRPKTPRSYQESVAETVPGPTSAALAARAAAYGIYISFGLTETAGGLLYNSQVLLDPSGTILSVHHKMHLTDWDIKNGFQAGDHVTFDTIDGVKVATIICFDGMQGKALRQVTAGRPAILILSLADMGSGAFCATDPIALCCNTWVITANRIGKEDGNVYDGHHAIATPIGSYRAKRLGAAGYVYANMGVWP